MVVYHGVGRRKSSVARAWLKGGSGKVVVNGKEYDKYFDTEVSRKAVVMPLELAEKLGKLDVKVNVIGGGMTGQADAAKLAIARALLQMDEALRPKLKEAGLLRVDSRLKERKKYGRRGARRGFQFVKR